jgi:hypothetical protein
MNRNLIYFSVLIVLVFTFYLTTIELFNSINAQVDSFQEQIEPIPSSNNINTNQTTPMIFSQ